MKYAPKKVFILENGDYMEISYEELRHRETTERGWEDKLFLPMHGMLMEVTKDFYDEFYRDKRRQEYITARSIANGDVSYDALDTDEFNGEDTLVDPNQDIAEQVAQKMMIEKLHCVLPLLSEDEQELIITHFYKGKSQTMLADEYGVNQSNISRKISRVLAKIKKLLET